jgi:hypothetical protein
VCGGNNWQRPWWQIYKKQEDEEVKNPHPSNSIQQVQKGMIIARDVKIVKCNNTFWTYWIQHFFYDRTKKHSIQLVPVYIGLFLALVGL